MRQHLISLWASSDRRLTGLDIGCLVMVNAPGMRICNSSSIEFEVADRPTPQMGQMRSPPVTGEHSPKSLLKL